MLTRKKFEDDLKKAMLERDDLRKRTLRMVLTSLKLAEVERQDELDEPTILGLIQKEVKTRLESIAEAKVAGRDDLIDSTQEEVDLLKTYLPEALSEDEIKDLVQSAIEEVGAEGPSDMGKVMKVVMPSIRGRADGKVVSELVRSTLSGS